MGLHRRLAEEEVGRDLGVRHAARDHAEDFEFLGGQRGQVAARTAGGSSARGRRGLRGCRGWRAGEAFDQAASDGRREQRIAGADELDGRDQVLRSDVLEQETVAQADKAAYTYSSRSNVVKMMIRVPAAPAATICLVASMPSSRGIRMSISTTSGRCWSAAAIACSPSAASASTSTPAASG